MASKAVAQASLRCLQSSQRARFVSLHLRSFATLPNATPSSSSTSTSQPSASASGPSEHVASPPAKKPPNRLLKGVARLLGYNAPHTVAVRSTNFYYNQASEMHRKEYEFWYDECRLPRSFQAWFQITNLYLWILTVRFRALQPPNGRYFLQELTNHFFIDAEYRMQKDFDVKQSRIVKDTLKIMLSQHRGSFLAYDEGLVGNDAMLAAALWRNIFGAAWGGGIGGVKGGKAPQPAPFKLDPEDLNREAAELEQQAEETEASIAAEKLQYEQIAKDAQFAVILEKLVYFVRSEVARTDGLNDQLVMRGPEKKQNDLVAFERLAPPAE